jgi:hypothetical protein
VRRAVTKQILSQIAVSGEVREKKRQWELAQTKRFLMQFEFFRPKPKAEGGLLYKLLDFH